VLRGWHWRARAANAHDFTYLRIAFAAQHARECGYDESISEQAFEIFIAERTRSIYSPMSVRAFAG